MCGPLANSSNNVGARQARPTFRLNARPEVGVKTTPALPDHACEFCFCSETLRESLRSAWSRRASARTPAKRVHFPDPGVHWSNANAAPETVLAFGTIGSRPLATL